MNLSEKPVGAAATIATLLIVLANAGVGMLTALGIVHWDSGQQTAINAFAVALVNVGAVILPYLWARKQVTPLAHPTDEEGNELVVKATGLPNARAARAKLRRKPKVNWNS